MYKDSVAIIKPVANGPSARAGIKAGDRILYDKTKLLRKLPSIVCFLDSKRKGSEVQQLFIENQKQKN
jgi:carboxyl-terminal processing protease